MILRRRTAKGELRYGVRVDRDGKQTWVGTFRTLAEARQAEREGRADEVAKAMTCDELVAFYLEGYRERVKTSSYDTAESALTGFSQDFKGIPAIRVDEVKAERWARENRWRVPSVITMMNWAYRKRLVSRNTFAGLSHKGEGRRRITPLTEAEVGKLARIAGELHGDLFNALVLFLGYTGARPGEAFALLWSDVDFDRNRVMISRRSYKGTTDLPKSNRARLVVLPPPARDALLPHKGEGHVFTAKRGGPLSQTSLAWYWQGIVARFDRKVTPYELRHHAAHHLYVRMGLPARVVAAQLGHSGPQLVEELYGHGEVGALDEIDAAFDNVIPLRAKSQEQ